MNQTVGQRDDTFTPASWQSGHSTQRARQLNQDSVANDAESKRENTDAMLNALGSAEELNSEIQRRRILKCTRQSYN